MPTSGPPALEGTLWAATSLAGAAGGAARCSASCFAAAPAHDGRDPAQRQPGAGVLRRPGPVHRRSSPPSSSASASTTRATTRSATRASARSCERLGAYLHGDFGTNLRGREVIGHRRHRGAEHAPAVLHRHGHVAGARHGARLDRRPLARPGRRTTASASRACSSTRSPSSCCCSSTATSSPCRCRTGRRSTFGEDSCPRTGSGRRSTPTTRGPRVLVPGILLGLAGSAAFIRLVRASQLESATAATTCGRRGRRAWASGTSIAHHVVRNSSVPVVTAVGLTFAEALGGAVITEGMMNIYGMGGVLWERRARRRRRRSCSASSPCWPSSPSS